MVSAIQVDTSHPLPCQVGTPDRVAASIFEELASGVVIAAEQQQHRPVEVCPGTRHALLEGDCVGHSDVGPAPCLA